MIIIKRLTFAVIIIFANVVTYIDGGFSFRGFRSGFSAPSFKAPHISEIPKFSVDRLIAPPIPERPPFRFPSSDGVGSFRPSSPKRYPEVPNAYDFHGGSLFPSPRKYPSAPLPPAWEENVITASKDTKLSSSPSRSSSPKRYPDAPLPPDFEQPFTKRKVKEPTAPKRYPDAPLPPEYEVLSKSKTSFSVSKPVSKIKPGRPKPLTITKEKDLSPSRTASVQPHNLSPPLTHVVAEPGFPKLSKIGEAIESEPKISANVKDFPNPSMESNYIRKSSISYTFSAPVPQFASEVILPTTSLGKTVEFFSRIFSKQKPKIKLRRAERAIEIGFEYVMRLYMHRLY